MQGCSRTCVWATVLSAQMSMVAAQTPSVIPAGKLELARLVDLAADRLKINIEYDESILKGSATLRLDAGVSDEQLWQLVNRLLAARGLTTIHDGGDGVFSVVRLADAPSLVQIGDVSDPPAGYQAVLISVQHRPADEIAQSISSIAAKPGGTTSALNDSTLLVTNLASRLDSTRELVTLLDSPTDSVAVEEIRLENLTGAQMATLVGQVKAKKVVATDQEMPGEVLPALDTMSVLIIAPSESIGAFRELIARLDSREPLETRTYASLHYPAEDVASLIQETTSFEGQDRWRLIIDDLTESLIVTASPAAHETIQSLVDRLDAVPSAARRPVRTFVIKNRSVLEVQEILERLIDAGVIDPLVDAAPPAAPSQPNVFSMPPPLANDDESQDRRASPQVAVAGRDVVLTSDEGTNTLIAIGEPRILAQIDALLTSLDVRQAQVMLEILMVTLNEGQTLDLGVELEKMTQYNDAQIRLSSLFGLSVTPDGDASMAPAGGLGFTGSVLSPGDFSILIRALETVNDGRSLSMPKLLVGNNQSATLDSVLQQPFASVNASNTVSTTSFGGTQDAGTIVTITPQIAEGDHLLLDYSLSLSSFQGASSTPALPPPRQQNSVSSAATIPDGFTVVVGGIELEDESKGEARLPLLGRIPIVGEAFKSRQRSSNRTRFYVFIRANILRDTGFEDLKYISEHDVAAMDVDDQWPTVSPRIIE